MLRAGNLFYIHNQNNILDLVTFRKPLQSEMSAFSSSGKNISLLVVSRDKKRIIWYVHTNARDDHNVTQKTAGNSINRDKTAHITFQVKGFLVYGTYENLIKKHRLLSDFLKSSTAYLTLKKMINKDQ